MANQRQRIIQLVGLLRDVDVVVEDLSGKPALAHVGNWWRASVRPFLEGLEKGRLPGPLAEEYVVLGLVPSASDEVVKAAYKALMKQHHPDLKGGDGELAKKLNESYEKICAARGIA